MPRNGQDKEVQFGEIAAAYGAALERLVRVYEADAETRRDLLQEILIALWRSLDRFDGRCSLRNWVYRIAHNVAASHVTRQIRRKKQLFVGLDELPDPPNEPQSFSEQAKRDEIDTMYELIAQLKPLDRQVMLAYLEGVDAASTAEITGLSAGSVATKIHRIKQILRNRFQEGESR